MKLILAMPFAIIGLVAMLAAFLVAIVGILTDSNYRATYKYSRRNKLNND